MPTSGLCRVFLRSPSESANTRTKCRHNSVVHFLASNVRRAMETCPIALAGLRRGGELLRLATRLTAPTI